MADTQKAVAPPTAEATKELALISFGANGLEITHHSELMRFASIVAKAPGFCPKGMEGKPNEIFLAMCQGAEYGFSPLRALQVICIINGKPSVYGDGVTELIYKHPKFEDMEIVREGDAQNDDYKVTVRLWRKGKKTPIEGVFTVAQAKRANLYKNAVWASYPEDMCMWKAMSRAKKLCFPDIGVSIAEDLIGTSDADYINEETGRPTKRVVAETVDDVVDNLMARNDPKPEPEPEPEVEEYPEPDEDGTYPEPEPELDEVELRKEIQAAVNAKKLSGPELELMWDVVDPMAFGIDNMDADQLYQVFENVKIYKPNRAQK